MVTFSIRPEQDDDAAGIRAVLESAFPSAAEADLVDALRENATVWEPGFRFVALDEAGTVIGYVLLTRCWVEHWPMLALAPVAVVPELQRQGIGSTLVETAIQAAGEEARAANLPAGIVVLGHADYYPRFGFETARSWGIRAPFDVPRENFMVLNLNPDFELPSGTVVYPPEFETDDEEDLDI